MSDVKAIPEGYPQITAYLCVDGAAAAIGYYEEVFSAKERMRIPAPDGRIGHAELEIGAGIVMLADEHPEINFLSPKTIGGTPVTISVYVEDVDFVYHRAIELGAVALRPVEDQFYGDRSGQFEDPFGHRWSVATHVRDVSREEMTRLGGDLAGESGGDASLA